ncbi:MAG: cytochrome c [Chloroflexota bacterium]
MNTPTKHTRNQKTVFVLSVALLAFVLAACGNLREQPKFNKAYDASPLFETAARELDPNAVPIGFARQDLHLSYGLTASGDYATGFPFEVTLEDIEEGRRLFEGYCAMCHGYGGYGDGVVALKGYPEPAPASFHIDRLVDAPEGYYFDVITNGQGQMLDYSARVRENDRWLIIAYIRALQTSQSVPLDSLPEDLQANFNDEEQMP